jgi:uncharacterized protein (TIGR02466 family)
MSYNFFYWGPVLFKTKISEEDKNKLIKLKTIKSIKQDLAGSLEKEDSVSNAKVNQILQKYFSLFYECYEHWYNKKIQSKLKVKLAWINTMKPGDFNPPHIHLDCNFSGVLYLKIDQKLIAENKSYIGRSRGPGSISFLYGNQSDDCISDASFVPEERDLYIFPRNLYHCVHPFKSNAERISMAFNLKWDDK